MLKLMLPSSSSLRLNFFILLVALLSVGSNSSALSAESIKDKFVFKIGGEVFAVSDFKEYNRIQKKLKCIYPESLLIGVFNSEFKTIKKKSLVINEKFTSHQKEVFLKMRSFFKLLVYLKSHDIVLNEQLTKYFFLSAKQGNCGLDVFDEKKEFTPKFKQLMHMEVFMRKRFLPSEAQGKSTPQDFKKAIEGVQALLKSIDPQVDEEVYW